MCFNQVEQFIHLTSELQEISLVLLLYARQILIFDLIRVTQQNLRVVFLCVFYDFINEIIRHIMIY